MSFSRSAAVSLAALALVAACDEKPEKAAPPAKVEHSVPESQLATVTLTAEAFGRLGIETAAVESATVAPARTVGGEVVVPPGLSLVVAAPMAGSVLAPEEGAFPTAGAHVAERQHLLRLIPLPADRDLVRAQQTLAVADARLRQAQAEADRVAKLFADRLVSARDNERAQADLAAARAEQEAAAGQSGQARGGGDAGGLTALAIVAPASGVIRTLSVAPGQRVAAGAALAEIVRLDRLWVRVPVYAGEAGAFARGEAASVHALAGAGTGSTLRAEPVTAPPSADAAASSVDLYFEIRGASSLRPGERVGVTIPLRSAGGERALSVPLSAIVHDMNGGAWVYERTDSLVFARRRVEIVRTLNGRAVLARGPAAGTRVVTAGVAELFGTEFGTGK